MKTRSLSRRILGIVLSAQLICALLLSAFALLHERHTRLRSFDESLKGRSDSVLGAIQDAEDVDNNVAVDARELMVPRGDSYRVYSGEGIDLGGTPNAPVALVSQPEDGFRDERADGITYRVYQRSGLRIIDRAETGGLGRERRVVIVYGSSMHHLEHEIFEAAGVYTSMILFVILGTGVLVVIFVRQALQPLEDFAGAAAQVAMPSLRFQLPASVMEIRELRPLADVLNDLIGKLRQAFTKERRFLEDAAHELKTAVAIVRSTVQVLLLKPRTTAEYTLGLDRMVEDISRVEALVAQMLSSTGTDDENAAAVLPLSLVEAAAEVISSLQPYADASEVKLLLESSGETFVKIRTDRATTLISNVLVNAIQHSDPGMLVRVAVRGAEQHRVILEVVDTGSGIGESALPHVFERFYREDRSRSRATGGAGLGLAICKSIVEANGGTITIKSVPGIETTLSAIFIVS